MTLQTTDAAKGSETENKAEKKEAVVVEENIPASTVRSDNALWKSACVYADMLSYCRPHKSRTEGRFIAKYIWPLGVSFDKFGNAYKQIGDNPKVLWSSHLDTVHTKHGMQDIVWKQDKKTGELFFLVGKAKSACLGADDTAGVWLMVEMIKNNIPGLYIFHRGEEVGRLGSNWIATNNKTALTGIKYAIAFDRRGEKSIITHQMSKKSCSDEFAKSLAEQLGLGHTCDNTGSYTDTASYVDLIPECTNISAGYNNAHCWNEESNVDYLFKLRNALLKLDVTKLVEARKAGDNERLVSSYSGAAYGSYYDEWDGYHVDNRKFGEDDGWVKTNHGGWTYIREKDKRSPYYGGRQKADGFTAVELNKKHKGNHWHGLYEWCSVHLRWFPKKAASPNKKDLGVTKTYKEKDGKRTEVYHREVITMIKNNPHIIADLLDMCGYNGVNLRDHLLEVGMSGRHIEL